MTVPSLSPSGQQAVLEQAEHARLANRRSLGRNLLGAGASFGAFFGLSALAPPVGLAALVSVGLFVTGAVFGFSAVKDAGQAAVLRAVRKEAPKEGFFARLKDKTAKLSKLRKRADDIVLYAIWGASFVVAGAVLLPAVVPSAVAAVLYPAVIAAGLSAVGAVNFLNGATEEAVKTEKKAFETILREEKPAQAPEAASVPAATPSPAKSFDAVAKQPAPVADTPAQPKTPPAPKP